MSDLLIIKSNRRFDNDSYKLTYADLLDQKANGLILLPPGLEVISTDKDVEIQPDCKWIPCSERLPEKEGLYLITIGRLLEVIRCHFIGGNWCVPLPFYRDDVVAWMPLPKAYKGE